MNIQEYYYHWLWGNNFIREDEPSYLINLELGVSIRFNYEESYAAGFEEFKNNIADVQFLNNDRPDDIEHILIDAWNYLAIEERISDGLDLDDINFE